jgi:hypothetical protein
MNNPKRPRVTLLTALVSLGFALAHPGLSTGQEPPASEADRVVLAVADQLARRYVSAEDGRRLSERLRAAVRGGAYPPELRGDELAARLTAALREATGDGHLGLEYSHTPLPTQDAAAAAEMEQRDRLRYYGPQLNFGFSRVELLADNIGYLELKVFAPLDWAAEPATAAMTLLAHADALIIDLRSNGGGHGETVQWLASYLLGAEPKPMSGEYRREGERTTQRWSLPYVPGERFGPTKPVFVLTSKRTFSAAEAFAYDLQALKRVEVVGERTGGGAHPYENVKLDEHYVLWLPTGRSVNPVTGGNWQGVGVQPDVKVKADEALAAAIRLARLRLNLADAK